MNPLRNPHRAKNLTTLLAVLLTGTLACRAELANDLIKKGDAYAQKLQSAEALSCYLPAEKLDPRNGKLLAHIAREYRHLMTDASSKDDKLRLGGVAVAYSYRAASASPNDVEAQLAPAISLGKLLPLEGNKEQLEATRMIKDSADKALKVDPGYDLAWHVLGKWHQVLADVSMVKRTFGSMIYGKLPSSTNQEAVDCFEKAIQLNPHRMMHYVELGRTYAQMGRPDDAKRCISKGLAMPCTEKDDPEVKAKGKQTLEKLQ
jgi:tetratricopeptide (TPR) repeat protein